MQWGRNLAPSLRVLGVSRRVSRKRRDGGSCPLPETPSAPVCGTGHRAALRCPKNASGLR